jgi:hypothetical protein
MSGLHDFCGYADDMSVTKRKATLIGSIPCAKSLRSSINFKEIRFRREHVGLSATGAWGKTVASDRRQPR